MLVENFQSKYTAVPVAGIFRDYKKHSHPCDREGIFHLHKEMEVLLVLEGEAQLHIDGASYTVSKGNLVILAPYTLHRYTLFADQDFKHYCLCFDLDVLYDKQLKNNIENHSVLPPRIIQDGTRCAEFIKQTFIALHGKKPGWDLCVIGNLSLFFSVLKADGYLQENDHPVSQSLYLKIFNYISQNFKKDITSSELAGELGFHQSYFCRLFRKGFGESFQNYLCAYRIEKSKYMLRQSELSVSQIASDVGFSSFSYYSKKFKAYNGITPSEYRKRN